MCNNNNNTTQQQKKKLYRNIVLMLNRMQSNDNYNIRNDNNRYFVDVDDYFDYYWIISFLIIVVCYGRCLRFDHGQPKCGINKMIFLEKFPNKE
ncbi:hypothetical protein DERP_009773 [Dermatophagoides pteronyssinus]|uniref:Uncharacterized protein n=1 Tax=Dermatophagoides pteronyssinus TaxID=6956 RepID=A0ABQ8IR37_DERPT|nr:hypothetical protein DERP_009773 [Dermatophagoides pteronyssinus]